MNSWSKYLFHVNSLSDKWYEICQNKSAECFKGLCAQSCLFTPTVVFIGHAGHLSALLILKPFPEEIGPQCSRSGQEAAVGANSAAGSSLIESSLRLQKRRDFTCCTLLIEGYSWPKSYLLHHLNDCHHR